MWIIQFSVLCLSPSHFYQQNNNWLFGITSSSSEWLAVPICWKLLLRNCPFHCSFWFRVMEMPSGALLKEWMGKDAALHLQLLILSTFSFNMEGSFLLILPLVIFFFKYNKKIRNTKNTNKNNTTSWNVKCIKMSSLHSSGADLSFEGVLHCWYDGVLQTWKTMWAKSILLPWD